MDAQKEPAARDNNWSKVSELPKVTRRPNPYDPPFHMWPPEVLEAYKTFPKHNGMNLPVCDETWPQWKAWLKKYADRKHLWPGYVVAYIEDRKRREGLKNSGQGQ